MWTTVLLAPHPGPTVILYLRKDPKEALGLFGAFDSWRRGAGMQRRKAQAKEQ
ncbi:hypothetical protein LTR28_006283, partial [Elasticomyces elasticus]